MPLRVIGFVPVTVLPEQRTSNGGLAHGGGLGEDPEESIVVFVRVFPGAEFNQVGLENA